MITTAARGIPHLLTRVGAFAEVSGERLRHALAPQRLGYIGSPRHGNLGDMAVYDAARRLLEGAALLPFFGAKREAHLARVGLSGPSYFESVILGGGTLINDMSLDVVRGALELGLPVWTAGTGVGKPGFFNMKDGDLRAWAETLPRLRRVGVRGPRSKAALAAIGFEGAEVVGDLALAMTLDRPAYPAAPRSFAVNFTLPLHEEHGPWVEETLSALEEAIVTLERRGLKAEFVAMHELDLEPLSRLKRRVGAEARPTIYLQDADEFFSLLSRQSFVIATRLHSAVLACCAGVPPLSLAYGPKCIDFVESMGLDHFHVDISSDPRERLAPLALELADRHEALRADVLSRALAFREILRNYVATTR